MEGVEGGSIGASSAVISEPSQSMDLSDCYSSFNRKVLSLSGLWYTQTYKERLVRYYIIGFMSLYNASNELCQIFTVNLDLQSAVRRLQILLPSICGVIIYSTFILHYIRLQKINNYIQHDWQQLKDDTELKIMQKHTNLTKRFNLVGSFIFYIYLTCLVLPSLHRIIVSNEIRRDSDFYPIMSCFDYFLNRETYNYPIVMYQILTSVVLGSLSISCYSVYISYIQHSCALLSIIKYKISYPFLSKDYKDNEYVMLTDHTLWIIDIAQRLTRTKEFVALVNSMSEKCYLLQIFLGFIILIIDFLYFFQLPVLLEDEKNRKIMLEVLIFIFGTILVIYIACYIGQRLMDYSMDVYKEVCMVPIHELSLKTQKLLLTTLLICSQPYASSIPQIYVASHVFFSNLLRSSLSFAIVLRSIQRI